ncbi:hypothetical protein BRADI_4g14181v3 [Brachypodium distachyon]|uniref:Uncharacterized protein n=1 Tax=Brachypodium distachyon TaxID=15368 RepID=A0A0Q3EJP3_BRADI|nr:hypothetical protein BRADI_4g14181v3 [Brachypodium distachyon]
MRGWKQSNSLSTIGAFTMSTEKSSRRSQHFVAWSRQATESEAGTEVGLEAGDAGGYGHGGDLARGVQLLVRVSGDHGQDLVGGDGLGTAEEGHGPAGEKEEAVGGDGRWRIRRRRAAAARPLGLDLACSGVGVRGGEGTGTEEKTIRADI